MALSDDQKAMLRLLAQREQGYDDLAALMGLSVDEVRAKVKDALAQLEAQGEAPPPLPAEPAAPPASEPAAEPARAEPPPPPQPADPVQAEPARPKAPEPEPAKVVEPSPRAVPKSGPSKPPRIALPKSSGARAAIAAGAVVIALVIVILAVGGGEDSGDPATSASGESTTAAEETIDTSNTNPKLTQAVLSPVDGGEAVGVATFGRVKNSLALQIEAEGLEPTGQGESYTVWLYESPRKMLPLASTVVPESGEIGAQVQVPTEVLGYLATGTFEQINISLTTDATLKASLAKATREKEAPLYTGTDVLRGRIEGPIIGAANKK
jgi:hypothetical protein